MNHQKNGMKKMSKYGVQNKMTSGTQKYVPAYNWKHCNNNGLFGTDDLNVAYEFMEYYVEDCGQKPPHNNLEIYINV